MLIIAKLVVSLDRSPSYDNGRIQVLGPDMARVFVASASHKNTIIQIVFIVVHMGSGPFRVDLSFLVLFFVAQLFSDYHTQTEEIPPSKDAEESINPAWKTLPRGLGFSPFKVRASL